MLKPTVFWDTWKVDLPWYSWNVGHIFPGLESNSQGTLLPDSVGRWVMRMVCSCLLYPEEAAQCS